MHQPGEHGNGRQRQADKLQQVFRFKIVGMALQAASGLELKVDKRALITFPKEDDPEEQPALKNGERPAG